MKIKVWTEAYNAMQMGGSCHYLLAMDVDIDNWFDTGKGFMCGRVLSPDGTREIIIEMKSGAIVGTKIEQVIDDISKCDDIKLIEKQIRDAIIRVNTRSTKTVSIEEFWRIYTG